MLNDVVVMLVSLFGMGRAYMGTSCCIALWVELEHGIVFFFYDGGRKMLNAQYDVKCSYGRQRRQKK